MVDDQSDISVFCLKPFTVELAETSWRLYSVLRVDTAALAKDWVVVVSEMQAGGPAGTQILCEVPRGTVVFFEEVKVFPDVCQGMLHRQR